MKRIRLLDLGDVPAVRSQSVYHAVARVMNEFSPDTIIFVSPSDPYVCIGFHQDAEREVDLEFCRSRGLPVIRRETGGGAVYLDSGQLFVQWIFHRRNLPQDIESCFSLYIRPLVETYGFLGVDAGLRPVNDIHVKGNKIGGTGAAEIGQAMVLVGSFMFHFDRKTMARVLKVPSEKMRDKIVDSLESYMTTLEEQMERVPEKESVKDAYLLRCGSALGAEFFRGELSDEEKACSDETDRKFASPEWLIQKGGLRRSGIRIHEDVSLKYCDYKAPGGLIRVLLRIRDGRIDDVSLSGDFILLPASGLQSMEAGLIGCPVIREILSARIEEIYRVGNIRSPGLAPLQIVEAVLRAAFQEEI